MPFVLTCDSCEAKLRTQAAPAVGKRVKCPKCAEQFVVSDENCEEVGAPKPAVAEASEDDTPPPRAKTAKSKPAPAPEPDESDDEQEEESPAPRKKAKARRDEEEDERPRNRKGAKKAKGGSGGKIALLIGGGVLLLLVLGVGGYFALRKPRETASSGGGNNTDNKVPQDGKTPPDGKIPPDGPAPVTPPAGNQLFSVPTRKLPKDLFAYWPSEQYKFIQFTDATIPKPDGQLNASLLIAGGWQKELGVKPEQIAQAVRFAVQASNINDVVSLYEIKTAFDLAEGSKGSRWAATTIQGRVAYKHPSRSLLACQVKPNLILFSELPDAAANVKRVEELLTRTPTDYKFPADVWAAIEQVSSYDAVIVTLGGEFRIQTGAKPLKFSVSGDYRSAAYSELAYCYEFTSAADAEQAEAGYKVLDEIVAKENKNVPGITVKYEIVGTRLYRVYRKQR